MELLRGLIKTSLIIAGFIAVGIIASVIISADLSNRIAAAYEQGYQQGHDQGYQAGFDTGSQTGYQEGSKTSYLTGRWRDAESYGPGFYFSYNPTYDEMRKLLEQSKAVSASEIHDYAETNGIRVAYVRCQIARQASEGMVYVHHLVAFETVDRGLIIIEPWSHREVNLAIGNSYRQLNGLSLPDYDDTITQIKTVW